jgi:hypothetical protein
VAAWVDRARVLIYKGSAWVDITDWVRFRRIDLSASAGRTTELEGIGPGGMSFGIDNSGGEFTPGSATASLELTLGMPIGLVEQIGYRAFNLWQGVLQLPETSEALEGVDNLVVVTAVDGKERLDNGRTFLSTLAEYVMVSPTLVHYYPLNEDRAPFRDVYGNGPTLTPSLNRSSYADSGSMAPVYTPNGGPAAPGDDLRGLLFKPDQSTAGGFGFPTFASGYELDSSTITSGMQLQPGELLTLIIWVSITDANDYQQIMQVQLYDSGFPLTAVSTLTLDRFMFHTSLGSDAGLLHVNVSAIGGAPAGSVRSVLPLRGTGGVMPIGVQFSYSPNTLKMWAGRDEFVGAAPVGTLVSPFRLHFLSIGAMGGSVSHVQIHRGAFAQSDFLAQFAMGVNGLAGQRTDERVATVLSYAGAPPSRLDLGVTYMQATGLAGKKPGAVIDEAVTTEQGRFYFDGDGVAQFHSRQRVYNV